MAHRLLLDARVVEEHAELAQRLGLAGEPGAQRVERFLGRRVIERRHIGGELDQLFAHVGRLRRGRCPSARACSRARPPTRAPAVARCRARRRALRPVLNRLRAGPAEHDGRFVHLLAEVDGVPDRVAHDLLRAGERRRRAGEFRDAAAERRHLPAGRFRLFAGRARRASPVVFAFVPSRCRFASRRRPCPRRIAVAPARAGARECPR